MIDVIMWIVFITIVIIDIHLHRQTVQEYKRMKEAKKKAMVWDARIK